MREPVRKAESEKDDESETQEEEKRREEKQNSELERAHTKKTLTCFTSLIKVAIVDFVQCFCSQW